MKPIAILVSDLHLSLKCPRCRTSELDWMEVQRRQLQELRDLQGEYDCPIICAGDIFHLWNANAELINFALKELPDGMLSIPGNHDAPWHDRNQLHRSAYGVLRACEKIHDLPPGIPVGVGNTGLELIAFPFGTKIESAPKLMQGKIRMAVAHAYIWTDGTGYAQADEKAHFNAYSKVFQSYDVVHLGDNHTPFHQKNVFNPGSFFRRTVDDQHPRVGLLMPNGKVKTHLLKSPEKDIIQSVEKSIGTEMAEGFEEYLASLRDSSETRLDFRTEVLRYVENNDIDENTASILDKAMEE